MEAVITIDVLRRSGADVTVASVEKQLPVDAGHGIKIVADALISDCGDGGYDLITLPVNPHPPSLSLFPPRRACECACVFVMLLASIVEAQSSFAEFFSFH